MAEKEGFEPSIPFWGIHDFQSCALGQLRDFSISVSALGDLGIIQQMFRFVNSYFYFFKVIFAKLDRGRGCQYNHAIMLTH